MLSDELKELKRRERHRTNAETRYWCDQYRLFAERAVAEAAVKDAMGGDEPFGYFRTEAFGWTDCKQDDVGAKPLYERPQTSQLNLDYLREMGRLEARIRELEQASAAVPDFTPAMAGAGMAAWDLYMANQKKNGNPAHWPEAMRSVFFAMLAASQPEVRNAE